MSNAPWWLPLVSLVITPIVGIAAAIITNIILERHRRSHQVLAELGKTRAAALSSAFAAVELFRTRAEIYLVIQERARQVAAGTPVDKLHWLHQVAWFGVTFQTSPAPTQAELRELALEARCALAKHRFLLGEHAFQLGRAIVAELELFTLLPEPRPEEIRRMLPAAIQAVEGMASLISNLLPDHELPNKKKQKLLLKFLEEKNTELQRIAKEVADAKAAPAAKEIPGRRAG